MCLGWEWSSDNLCPRGPFLLWPGCRNPSPQNAIIKQQVLFYCLCIKINRYRYNYGRQANKTLAKLVIPSVEEIPEWVASADLDPFKGAKDALNAEVSLKIETTNWGEFRYDVLFDIKKGQRLTKSEMVEGDTPFIGAITSNNGYRQYVNAPANHPGGTITVNYNGNGVAEAFYQPNPFRASDDVNILYPKFEMTPHVAMFICTLIRREKFRFSYGRKWHLGRMNRAIIRLPITLSGEPDWEFVEDYIQSLPYSKSI